MSSRSIAEEKAIQEELNRLYSLTGLQLMDVLNRLETDPAPKWIKDLVAAKCNEILNYRLENLEIL